MSILAGSNFSRVVTSSDSPGLPTSRPITTTVSPGRCCRNSERASATCVVRDRDAGL